MLVLVRKEGEQIVVPKCGMTVTILGVEGKRVRLGVAAPSDLAVRRGEQMQDVSPSAFTGQNAAAAALEDPLSYVRVLIAESDEFLLDQYRQELESRGFDVRTATNGLECLDRLREQVPELLVLEPAIPWGGGDGVLARMHEESDLPRVPVLVMTYGRDRGVLYRLAPYPIDDYQVKPLSAKRLADRIHLLVKRRRLESTPPQLAR